MKVSFDYLDEFARGAKALRKRYPSFESDYDTFLNELEKNPFSGESLGNHTYKHRMAIASKGKGKSGGARVITYNLQQVNEEEVLITLMSIRSLTFAPASLTLRWLLAPCRAAYPSVF